MEVSNKKTLAESLICLGIAACLFALGFYTNLLFLAFLALFMPMLFIYVRAASGILPSVIVLVLFCALVFMAAGYRYAITFFCCIAPIAFGVGFMLRKKYGFYYSALVSCATILAALGILLLCISLLWGATVYELILGKLEAIFAENPEQSKVYYQLFSIIQSGNSINYESIDLAAINAIPVDTAISGLMRIMTPQIYLYVPQICSVCIAAFGLLNFIIPRAALKARGYGVAALPPFAMWSLPKFFGTWTILLLVFSYIGVAADWNNFDLVYSIVIRFMSVIYSVQGMALIDWLLKKKMQSKGGRVAIIAVTFVLVLAINLYMWLGFFEQIIKIRKRSAQQ